MINTQHLTLINACSAIYQIRLEMLICDEINPSNPSNKTRLETNNYNKTNAFISIKQKQKYSWRVIGLVERIDIFLCQILHDAISTYTTMSAIDCLAKIAH